MRHHITLKIGPATFRVGSDWAGPIVQLRQLYSDYPAADPAEALATVRLEANRPWRRVIRPSVHIRGDYTIADALPLPLRQGLLAAEMGMNLQMALGWRRHMLLHASAVEKNGCAVIMSGESGSGKSTLSAMLGEAGWRFMGDEFTLLCPQSGDILGFPRPVSLKNSAIAAMHTIVPEARFGPLLRATPKGDIRHIVPPQLALDAMDIPARPHLLVFPRFGDAVDVRAIPPAEAFMRLTEASTNYVALGEPAFEALSDFVKNVPAFAVSYPDGATGMELVQQLFDGVAA